MEEEIKFIKKPFYELFVALPIDYCAVIIAPVCLMRIEFGGVDYPIKVDESRVLMRR